MRNSKPAMHKCIYLLLSLNIFLITCEREWNNPYDPESSDISSPTNLNISLSQTDGLETATLSWQDNSVSEDSFIIEQKIGSGDFSILDQVDENITTYLVNTSNFTTFELRPYIIKSKTNNYYSE